MVRPRKSSAASEESAGTAQHQVCFFNTRLGRDTDSGNRSWGVCTTTSRRSYYWARVEVGSELGYSVSKKTKRADQMQIMSAASLRQERMEGAIFPDHRSRVRKQDD